MSTAVTGAPAVRSAASARCELPHATNSGSLHEERDGSVSMMALIWFRRSGGSFVLMRSSWIVPSASGVASAS